MKTKFLLLGVGLMGAFLTVFASGNNQSLNVNFYNVRAKVHTNKVSVSWLATHDKSLSYYAVERSQDGVAYDEFDGVMPGTQYNTQLNYNAVDFYPVEGVNFYRVRAVGHDGTESLSAPQEINYMSRMVMAQNTSVYPNPSTGTVVVSVKDAPISYLGIKDITGKDVNFSMSSSGTGSASVNLSSSPNGNYFMMIHSQGNIQTVPIIINK